MSIYLDYNASAPIDQRVLDVMISVYQNHAGNADSRTHEFGDDARRIVEKARSQVASILGIKKDEVFFTSGATESNNIALQGLKNYAKKCGKKHIITSNIEHKAVFEAAKAMALNGFEVDFVNPDRAGRVSANEVNSLVRNDTLLVSIMHVNNETGIIQPVDEIGEFLADKETFFHVDATQSFGKLVDEIRVLKYDMLSMSAHKIGGPQGVGLLALRKRGFRLPPIEGIMYGGKQERGIRPGTIPVALVAGLGAACEYSEEEYQETAEKCAVIKECLLTVLRESGLSYDINGDQKHCVPNTINLCLYGVSSEALMLASKQYCSISNGSACNSSTYNSSIVLRAMGIPADMIDNSIRISWGAKEDICEIKDNFQKTLEIAKSMARPCP